MDKFMFSTTDKSTSVKTMRVYFFYIKGIISCKCVPQKQINKHLAFDLNWYTVMPALHVNPTNFLCEITSVHNTKHKSEQVLYILSQERFGMVNI